MSKQRRPVKTCYRLAPCPSYDVPETEAWLSELAEEGLFLAKDGMFACAAAFERKAPAKVKYRLEADQRGLDILFAEEGPTPEELGLSEKYSWEYVAKKGGFYIYRSADPSARELNTDPKVQAMALNALKKRRGVMLAALTAFLLALSAVNGLVRGAVFLGPLLSGLLILFAALLVFDEARALVRIGKMQTALLRDGHIATQPYRRENTTKYYAGQIFRTAVVLLLIFAALRSDGIFASGKNLTPLAEHSGDLPFATIRDFAGADYRNYLFHQQGSSTNRINTIEEKSDSVVGRYIDYTEAATSWKVNGASIKGVLHVEYYEMSTEWLARIVSSELYCSDWLRKSNVPVEAPDLDADYTAAYSDRMGRPTVIIRKGNVAIRASYYDLAEANVFRLPFEEWTAVLGESLHRTGSITGGMGS